MSGQETRALTQGRTWKTWLSAAGGVVAVAAVCVAIHRYSGPDAASAQAPVVKPGSAGAAKSVPGGSKSASGSVKQAGATTPVKPDFKGNSAVGGQNAAAKPATGDSASTELKVMAFVNGEQITRQDLARECLQRYGKDVLQSIMNKHLILQACQQRGVKITEQNVEDEIARLAGKFGLSPDRWLVLLETERNISASEYRREIIWPTLALRALAANQIEVTPLELRDALESEHGPKVKARLIAVKSKQEAQDVLAKAKANPDDFENLAKELSKDPSASVMGLIPPIRKHVGEKELEDVAFRLKPGEVSSIVPVGDQYVILKCEQQFKATLLTGKELERVKEQLSDRIRDQKMRASAADLFGKLQKEGKVENIFNNPAKQKQHPGVAAMINGQPITIRQLAEECITRHGTTVLDGEINRLLLTQELKRKHKVVEETDLTDEVARAAETYGFFNKDGSPDIERWTKTVTENDKVTYDLYLRDAVWPTAALKKIVGGKIAITEDDLKKAFEANYGERVEVLAIVLGNQRQAQQVWEQARDIPRDNFFGDLAQQYSIEPASKANFGKVPPIRRHSGQPAVEEQAFKLKPGNLSPIISVGDKFIVLRCLGRTKPLVPQMDDAVRKELKNDLQEKKLRLAMNDEFDRLKDAAEFDNFLTGTSHSPAQSGKNGKGAAGTATTGKGPPSVEPRAGSVSSKKSAGTMK